ncbi:MAG: tetratricopeptide repeat protein [Thermoguttaceae bacterium]
MSRHRKKGLSPPDRNRAGQASDPFVANNSSDRAGAIGGSTAPAAAPQRKNRRKWLAAAALVVAVFLAYQPAWHGGFVWDDDLHLLHNPVINRPDGLKQAWLSGEYINYWPLTFTVYWLEHKAWGLDPLGFHLVNIALHALSAVLVWRILERLGMPGAMLAAAIFALHPVNVESVAWIAQLKGLLSLPLALLAMLFYLRHERDGSWWQLAAAVGLFLLSALAKGLVLTLPVVLLACTWWQRGRIGRRDLLRVLPFVLVAALMVWVEVSKQHTGIADTVVRSDGLLGRAAVAGCAVWFYFWKVLWPVNLIFVYPRWTIGERDLWAYLPGVLLAVILAVAWWRRRSWGRPVVMLIVCYVALLLPVLGFADIIFMQYSLVADHWQYAAMIVPCAALAALFATLARYGAAKPLAASQTPKAFSLSHILCFALLAILATLTFRQSRMYADMETLYRTTLDRNPGCWLVQNNLGNLLADEGKVLIEHGWSDEATPLYRDAMVLYHDALRTKPDYADAHLNLGNALASLGRMDEAIGEFQRAIDANRNFVKAYCALGRALSQQGRFEEAISCYHTALQIDSDDLVALNELAWLRATCPKAAFRNAAEAVFLAEHASKLPNGREATVLDTLAAAYAAAGRFSEAVDVGHKALDLATLQHNPALAKNIIARVQLYMAKTPYRQPAPAPARSSGL